MRHIALTFMMAFMAMPAVAQTEETRSPVCDITARYQSGEADYKPGVDVNGNEVVPADLNDGCIKQSEGIHIPLQLDLADRLQRIEELGITSEGQLGFVDVYADGRVAYNGKDISSHIETYCGLEPKEVPAENGQKQPDAIQSEPISTLEANQEKELEKNETNEPAGTTKATE